MLCQLNKVMIPEIEKQITEIISSSINRCNQCKSYLFYKAI